jgi:hypothetical protein
MKQSVIMEVKQILLKPIINRFHQQIKKNLLSSLKAFNIEPLWTEENFYIIPAYVLWQV